VRFLKQYNPHLTVSSTPRIGAVFSSFSPTWGAVSRDSHGNLYGHTGIVVGISETSAGKRVTVLEAGAKLAAPHVRQNTYTWTPGQNVTFAYTGDYLK